MLAMYNASISSVTNKQQCCVPYCARYFPSTAQTCGIHYHQFPADEGMGLTWMSAIFEDFDDMPISLQLDLLSHYKKKQICSRHFLPSDYYTHAVVDDDGVLRKFRYSCQLFFYESLLSINTS